MLGLRSLTFSAALLAAASPSLVEAQDVSMNDPFRAVSFMEWRELGPAVVGGRISDLAVVEDDSRIIYAGTATAGVWKSTNHGTTWDLVFDGQGTSSVGDVTLAPSNPNIVWVGTGEPQNRQSSPWGDGVYKSLDGGNTWHHMGLRETLHIARIQIHPRNPDVVYVAAVGGLWGPNPERGVFRTMDGGVTWEHVLSIDEFTGAIDLVMDPGDPNTLFAAMYQRQRSSWGFRGGGPGSGIYRTLDGGDSWERLSEGLPDVDMGRIGLGIYRRDGNEVFAIVEAQDGGSGVYRSHDRGDTWAKTSDTNPRPMYYSQIWIDPNNIERVYLGGPDLWRSNDGGRTFSRDGAVNVHLDHHALWIDPSNSNHLIIGSDGGVSASFDGSESWRFYDNLPIAQFYEIGYSRSRDEPYIVCGGLQDNGSWCGPSNTLDSQGKRNADWYNVGGGDGFYVQIDPVDPTIMWTESQNGRIGRFDAKTGERAWVIPTPRAELDEGSTPMIDPGDDEPDEDDRQYRANWNTPLQISKHDRNTIYVGYQMLLRSRDNGLSWEQISPDLTYAIDRNQLELQGETPREDWLSMHDGVSMYSALTTIGESPMSADLVYTGSDDGRVMRTNDGGATWTDLTPNFEDVPANTYVSRVVPSAHREERVYVTFDGHYSADFAPYVYRSDDYGASWERITSGLPMWSVNTIAEHPDAAELLFVGNEVGLYASIDGGRSWNAFMNGLPTVPVDDIAIQPDENDLLLGTHGRGIWVMDDVTAIEELARTPTLVADAHLFGIGRVVDWRTWNVQEWTAQGEFRIPNPPNGANIRYWIPDAMMAEDGDDDENGSDPEPPTEVEIQILPARGDEPIRTLTGPASPGAHEVRWDFRIEPAYEAESGGGGGFFGRGGAQGPKVLPGVYRVQVDYAGNTLVGDMVVRLDPRLDVERSVLAARQDAMMSVYELQAPNYHAGRALRRIEEQLDDVDELLEEAADPPETIAEEVEAIREAAEALSDELGDLGIGFLRFTLEASTSQPTEDQMQAIDRAWEGAPGVIERINALVTGRMPELYDMLDEAGVRADPGEPIAIPRRRGGR